MKYHSKLAHITEINFKSEAILNKLVKLEIKGQLSSTVWELEEEKISIEKEAKIITISIKSRKKTGAIGMDIITDFSKEIELSFPEKGNWIVRCNNVEKEITIE